MSTPHNTNPSMGSNTKMIGLYGISGCGKTRLLDQLKIKLDGMGFDFMDGSTAIDRLIEGGLDAFNDMSTKERHSCRETVIQQLAKECRDAGKHGLIAGHSMLWPEQHLSPTCIDTGADWATYNHIIYLDVDAEQVHERREHDDIRQRGHASVAHLHRWGEEEKAYLRKNCLEHGILLSVVSRDGVPMLEKVAKLLLEFVQHDEEHNTVCATADLDQIMQTMSSQPKTMFVFDADRTLAQQDTGKLFWDRQGSPLDPLKAIFKKLGYSYNAFRRVTFMYENTAKSDVGKFEQDCEAVASVVAIHPGFLSLFHKISSRADVGAVIISCGLRTIWDKVLEKAGLSEQVSVIAGGRISDKYVMTQDLKAMLVSRLQIEYGARVVAFGDSPIDLPMLRKADSAVVVVSEADSRSTTIDTELAKAISEGDFKPYQVLIPNDTSARLDKKRLPPIELQDIEATIGGLRFIDASQADPNGSKLLATHTRHRNIYGLALREAHGNVGHFLSVGYVADLIGLEEVSIPRVQGGTTQGHRLLHENATLIVPLMRGGEPMAFGVHTAFPEASFMHANQPSDIRFKHVQHFESSFKTIVLVDSVVNSGQSIVEYIQHIRKLHPAIRIVVVAGVVQKKALDEDGKLKKDLAGYGQWTLVALRTSDNQCTGQGGTDTWHRLFNTTHLE